MIALLLALTLWAQPEPLSLDRQYQGTVMNVLDGDTFTVDLDLGLGVHRTETIRMLGLDAPEKITPEGKVSKAFLTDILIDKDCVIITHKDKREKYGRLLGTVWLGSQNINELLIQKGMAKPYDGGAR